MATYTSSTFHNNQPIAPHIGNVTLSGTFVWPSAGSVGDVVFLCKIPHGAVIVDMAEDHTNGQTAIGVSFGLASGGPAGSATLSCFIAAGAMGTFNRRSVLSSHSVLVSCSDSDPNRYGIFCASPASGSPTASISLYWTLTYRMYGPTS